MRLSPRHGWIALAAVVLTASVAPAAAVSQPRQVRAAQAVRPGNGFSPAGPWNTPLPAKVPLAPNSAAIVRNIVRDRHKNFGFWALNTDTYSSPIFTVGPHTPTQRWAYTNCLHDGDGRAVASSFAHVPTPRHLIVSKGTDAETAIYQPSTGRYWDFWRARKNSSGHWAACWGGEITHYPDNPGIFAYPLGATATGLPLGAFVIRISELQRGQPRRGQPIPGPAGPAEPLPRVRPVRRAQRDTAEPA
jgi:hypothetical protein